MYADDGILYSNEEFSPYPPSGLEFAEEKSKWLKKSGDLAKDENGVTIESQKFLGVRYN